MRLPARSPSAALTAPAVALIAALTALAVALIAAPTAHASTAFGPAMPAAQISSMQAQGVREIIVKRAPGLSAGELSGVRAQAGITFLAPGPLPNTELDRAPAGGLATSVAALRRNLQVQYAEPNGIVHATATPNDPYFPYQWALRNTGQTVNGSQSVTGTAGDDIGATTAWNQTIGSGVTVAVVDTGADWTAADLAGRLIGGASFFGGVQGSSTQDGNGHGTHVSGIIAADQNNAVGVSGVAPGAQVMPLQVLDSSGSGDINDVAAAFNYAGNLGIPVVNASLGGAGYSQTLSDAVSAHPGTLYVVAAGNDGANNDSTPFFPCDLPAANLICVGASDQNDQPASFSNYGATNVDLFAPGVNILSTYLTTSGDYAYDDGTSMATPMVSGTLALMAARNPLLGAAQLKSELMGAVDPRPQLAGLSVSGGRLDAAAAVNAASVDAPWVPPPPGPPAPVQTPTPAAAPALTTPALTPAPQPSPPAPGLRLTRVAVVGKAGTGRGQALVFTLSAQSQVQISLARAGQIRVAADVLRRALSARKGQNRYWLSSLLHGRRLARGRYVLTVRAGSRTVSLRLTV